MTYSTSKPLLYFSAAMNLILVGVCYWLLTGVPQPAVPIVAVQPSPAHPPSIQTNFPAPVPFRWAQVQSDDSQVYISNLRSIGCPEQTIQSIVGDQVAAPYEAKLAKLDPSSEEARQVQQEEQAQLATIFSAPAAAEVVPSGETGQAQIPPGSPGGAAASSAPDLSAYVNVPLVFQIPENADSTSPPGTTGAAAPPLNPSQQKAVNGLRQNFVDSLAGANQDPGDPKYAEKWIMSQLEIDDQTRARLGTTAFNQYQIQAVQQGGVSR